MSNDNKTVIVVATLVFLTISIIVWAVWSYKKYEATLRYRPELLGADK